MTHDKYSGPGTVHPPETEAMGQVANIPLKSQVDAPQQADNILLNIPIPGLHVPSTATVDGPSRPQKPKPRLKSICKYHCITASLN